MASEDLKALVAMTAQLVERVKARIEQNSPTQQIVADLQNNQQACEARCSSC